MIVVITNDDGVEAPGLAALVAAVQGIGRPVVVAPLADHSSCSHHVTTTRALAVTRLGEDRYGVDGSPADCVRLALHTLVPQAQWVLSGINAGANLGCDIVHSGTVAAAREAVLHGRQGLAISHYRAHGHVIDWAQAQRQAAALIPALMAESPGAQRLWNVNLPSPVAGHGEPRVVRCAADPSALPLTFRSVAEAYRYSGDYHRRQRQAGMDIATCFAGDISVSAIGLW